MSSLPFESLPSFESDEQGNRSNEPTSYMNPVLGNYNGLCSIE